MSEAVFHGPASCHPFGAPAAMRALSTGSARRGYIPSALRACSACGFGAIVAMTGVMQGCYSTGNSSWFHAELSQKALEDRVYSRWPIGTLHSIVEAGLRKDGILVHRAREDRAIWASCEDPWWSAQALGLPRIARAAFEFDRSDGLERVRWTAPEEIE